MNKKEHCMNHFCYMEDKESFQLCTRCSSVSANHVIDNGLSLLYCAACAVQGCGPPLVSRFRNTTDACDSFQGAQLSSSNDMVSVDDNDYYAHCHMLNDTPQNVLLHSPDLMDATCQSGYFNFCHSNNSKLPEEGVVASSDQLQDVDSVSSSRCHAEQSSMTELIKLMEMLAHDEDIQDHCGIATDDDGGDAVCCQFDDSEVDFEDSLIKQPIHSQSDSDAVLPLSNAEEDHDGLVNNMHQVAVPKSDQQLDDSPSDVFYDTVMSDYYQETTFTSARGSGCLGFLFCSFN